MRRYQDVAFRVAYLITGSATEAEDAAQEGFVRAYRAFGRFRPGSPLRPWLLRVVANTARNRRTAAARHPMLALDAAGADVASDPRCAPEATVQGAERDAVADRIGLPGVVIHVVGPSETEQPAPAGARLWLGQRVELGQAQKAVEFVIALPAAAALSRPDEVYLLSLPGGPMVSAVYRARRGLPPSRYTGVAPLVTQFEGAVHGGMMQKSVLAAEPESWSVPCAHPVSV